LKKSPDPDQVADAMVRGAQRYIEAQLSPILRRLTEAEAAIASQDTLERMVEAAVAKAIGAISPVEPSFTIGDVTDLINRIVAELPPPDSGKDGAPGKLPLVKAWEDRVWREADCCTHDGATWQANKDTGKAPPHADWTCLAAAGQPGAAAEQIEVRETYDPDASYRRLNIVALNGGAFIARKDDPGPCPGDDWQVIAMRGKTGAPGEGRKGDPGVGIKGDPGPRVERMTIDGEGMLELKNSDGSIVRCDTYPVLAKLGPR